MKKILEKCGSCGKEVVKGYEVCTNCGEKLHDLESQGKSEELRTSMEQNDYKGVDGKDNLL